VSDGNVTFEKGAWGGVLRKVLTAPPVFVDMRLAHALQIKSNLFVLNMERRAVFFSADDLLVWYCFYARLIYFMTYFCLRFLNTVSRVR